MPTRPPPRHPLPRPPPRPHGHCSAARPRPPGTQPAALARPRPRSARSRDPRAPRRRVAGASQRPVRAPARPISRAPRRICMPRPAHRLSLPAPRRPRAPPTKPLRPAFAPRSLAQLRLLLAFAPPLTFARPPVPSPPAGFACPAHLPGAAPLAAASLAGAPGRPPRRHRAAPRELRAAGRPAGELWPGGPGRPGAARRCRRRGSSALPFSACGRLRSEARGRGARPGAATGGPAERSRRTRRGRELWARSSRRGDAVSAPGAGRRRDRDSDPGWPQRAVRNARHHAEHRPGRMAGGRLLLSKRLGHRTRGW